MSLWSKKFLGLWFISVCITLRVLFKCLGSETRLTYTLFCNCSSCTLRDTSYSASFIHLIERFPTIAFDVFVLSLTFVARRGYKTTTHLLKLLSGKRGVAPFTPTRGCRGPLDPGLLYFKNWQLSPMQGHECGQIHRGMSVDRFTGEWVRTDSQGNECGQIHRGMSADKFTGEWVWTDSQGNECGQSHRGMSADRVNRGMSTDRITGEWVRTVLQGNEYGQGHRGMRADRFTGAWVRTDSQGNECRWFTGEWVRTDSQGNEIESGQIHRGMSVDSHRGMSADRFTGAWVRTFSGEWVWTDSQGHECGHSREWVRTDSQGVSLLWSWLTGLKTPSYVLVRGSPWHNHTGWLGV